MPRISNLIFHAALIFILGCGIQAAHAVTYTTIANGAWNSASTWSGGTIPDGDLTGDSVTISHRVNYPDSLGDLSVNDGVLTVNKTLILNNADIRMDNTAGRVNITNGLVILNKKDFQNDQGVVTLTDGAIQLCDGDYTVRNSARTTGTDGYIFSKKGDIERFDPGFFNSSIKWCIDDGAGTGLHAENCGAARPPAGDCLNESHYLSLDTTIMEWDTPMSLYKTYSGLVDYKVIGNSELKETNGSNNCKNSENSSAALSLPAGAKIVAAYLYWYAMEKNIEDGFPFIPVSDSIPATFVSTPFIINASRSLSSAVQPNSSRQYIHAGRFADVTSLLPTNPNGVYTIDVTGGATPSACPLRQENARGWSLVVVYEDPAITAANRVYIYDGFVGFLNSNITVPVSGYKIPALRPGGDMTAVSLQGDPGLSGEFLNTSDTTFPNYPVDFANSSAGAALDIDTLAGNYIADSTNMSLNAGSNQDLIYLTNIIVKAPSEMDFSDGPASYSNATHGIPLNTPTLYLGSTPPDDDVDSETSPAANWDDTHGSDDEGGIMQPSEEWEKSQTEDLPIDVTGTGFISVWIDWNQDGDFNDADEQIANGQSVSTGTLTLSVLVPANATGGDHMVRVRICSVASECNTPGGYANDGEAEDYIIPVRNCIGLEGDVSEIPRADPPQITTGSKTFVASRTPVPAEGHLKAFEYTDAGIPSTTAAWDAATLMDAAERTNNLYSTDTTGVGVLFNNLDDAAFEITTLPVSTIKSYTLNPSFGSGAYLAGRQDGSFLGPISRGNSIALVTKAINQSRFLDDAAYRTFYNNTVSTRSEKVLVTSDDGFLYAFNQTDGELSWGWMPRTLIKELKNYETFQSSLFMRGSIEIIDAKDSAGAYGTYVAGSYQNGLGHYVLKLSNTAGLDSVVWDEDRSTSFISSPNRGEMSFFSDGVGNIYGTYVVTATGNLSTLVISNLLTSAITEVPLDFEATSTPFIMPDFGNANAPAKKTLYLGDGNGNIRRASLLISNPSDPDVGELNTVATLQAALQNTTFSGDLGATQPILFLGASISTNGQYYLRAQSDTRITVLSYNPSTTNWLKAWTSYAGGAGKWDDTGTTFTPDTSGPATDLDNDGTLDLTADGIQSLPTDVKITDAAQIVANSIILPISIPISGKCYGDAYLNFYKLPSGDFPDGIFTTGGNVLLRNYYLGFGEATRVKVSDMPGKDKMKINSNSDQRPDGTTRPDDGLETEDIGATGGIRGWQEIGRE